MKNEERCVAVGTGLDDGFFSLEEFKGKLYAGGFGYRQLPMLFRYPAWEVVAPGLSVTESICELREFGGQLYANTENNGRVYRSADGEQWERVFDPPGGIGCVLREFKGRLYATIHESATGDNAQIYATDDGRIWQKVYDSGDRDEYMKELIVYQDMLFAFYIDKESGEGGYLTSRDGADWVDHKLGQVRLFKGLVHDGTLWASSSEAYTREGASAVWRYDGETFVPVAVLDGYSHLGELAMHGGRLWVTATRAWKGHGGGASLLSSGDTGLSWEEVCAFDETEAWNLLVFAGELYVSTKQHRAGGRLGRVYKVVASGVKQ